MNGRHVMSWKASIVILLTDNTSHFFYSFHGIFLEPNHQRFDAADSGEDFDKAIKKVKAEEK